MEMEMGGFSPAWKLDGFGHFGYLWISGFERLGGDRPAEEGGFGFWFWF